MIRCYLGLGSNLQCPERQIRKAICRIRKLEKSNIVRVSNLYKTKPLTTGGFQPYYCNAVVAIHVAMTPRALLRHCQSIENKQQRIRKQKWGARTLDVDILLYGQLKFKNNRLTIPHPELYKRDFVIIPLLEIEPQLKISDHLSLSE